MRITANSLPVSAVVAWVALSSCTGIISTDVSKIWFFSFHAGQYDIFRMDGNGSHRTQLTNTPEASTMPAVRRDGGRIAYCEEVTTDGGTDVEIFVMDPDGSNVQRLTNEPGDDLHPSFTPDGSHIVYERLGDIWIMNDDGSNKTQITNDGLNRQPSVSPDGTKVVFSRFNGSDWDIYVMSLNGSNLLQLTATTDDDSTPRWSHQGALICFSRGATNGRICWMQNNGSGLRLVTSGAFRDTDPVFTLDSKYLIFARSSSAAGKGTSKIYKVRIDGLDLELLSETADDDFGPAVKGSP